MGKWYSLAKASTCPYWLKQKGDSAVGTLLLDKQTSANTISVTKTKSRQGICKQSSDEYQLRQTPGRFQYYFSPCDADVDMYVVDTDYDGYALVVEHKHKHNSDKIILFVSLYGRTPVLPEASMETFRRVVTEQGMTEDHIGIQKNKGECSPGDVVIPDKPDTPDTP
ncbi:protein AMBP-like [Alosa sapidissima]|uniref:protein AMBP-like n=1 Tax=Alosa sapidissima TaxID=34773 RepID=UPI001C081576|nr:protein AMBP-like [Alosa sapidissima]